MSGEFEGWSNEGKRRFAELAGRSIARLAAEIEAVPEFVCVDLKRILSSLQSLAAVEDGRME